MGAGYKLREIIDVSGRRIGIGLQETDLNLYDDSFFERARAFERVAQDQPSNPFDDGLCYQHARELTLDSDGDLYYADGLGGIFEGEQNFGEPWGKCGVYACVPHAWCVNKRGEVVDPSWDATDNRFYFGIPIPIADVKAHQADRESSSPTSTRPVLSLAYMELEIGLQEAGTEEFQLWLDSSDETNSG